MNYDELKERLVEKRSDKTFLSTKQRGIVFSYMIKREDNPDILIDIEEMSELEKELSKVIRGKKSLSNLGLIEEIADTAICMVNILYYENIKAEDMVIYENFINSFRPSQKDIDDGSYIFTLIKNMNILAMKISDQLCKIPNNLESICSYKLKVDAEMSGCAFLVLSYLKVLVEENNIDPDDVYYIIDIKVERMIRRFQIEELVDFHPSK